MRRRGADTHKGVRGVGAEVDVMWWTCTRGRTHRTARARSSKGVRGREAIEAGVLWPARVWGLYLVRASISVVSKRAFGPCTAVYRG